MITVKFLGGAKKSFGTDMLTVDSYGLTIKELLDYLKTKKPENSLEFDIENLLIAVNGTDSSAIQGQLTKLQNNDVVSIIPVIHGGSRNKIQFSIGKSKLQLVEVKNTSKFGVDFIDKLRKKFSHLTIQAVSSRFILNSLHAKKIIALSVAAKRSNTMLAKKLETDIILRFACTTQISQAIKKVGIKKDENFVIIAIGKQSDSKKLGDYLEPYLVSSPLENNNKNFVKKQFKISEKQTKSVVSNAPLEDLLVEKAAVLF